jgi:hypothetical protein
VGFALRLEPHDPRRQLEQRQPEEFPVSESQQQQPGQQEQQHRFSRACSPTVPLDGRTPDRAESRSALKADKPQGPAGLVGSGSGCAWLNVLQGRINFLFTNDDTL